MTKVWKSGAVLGLALVVAQLAIAATGAGNGKLLAFTSLRGGNASLYVANRDGSGARRLTLDGGGAYQGDAAWAPDGTRLVFTCGNFELCVTSSNGSGTARLTKSELARQLELRLRACLVARRHSDRLQPEAWRAK